MMNKLYGNVYAPVKSHLGPEMFPNGACGRG
jgi:hypothetical protein